MGDDKHTAPIVCVFAILVFGISGWVFDNDSCSDFVRGAASVFEIISVCVAFTSMWVMIKDVSQHCQLTRDEENGETPLLVKCAPGIT